MINKGSASNDTHAVAQWPGTEVTLRHINEILPYAKNPYKEEGK